MDAEVDLDSGLLRLDGPNSIIDLLVAVLIHIALMGGPGIHPGGLETRLQARFGLKCEVEAAAQGEIGDDDITVG